MQTNQTWVVICQSRPTEPLFQCLMTGIPQPYWIYQNNFLKRIPRSVKSLSRCWEKPRQYEILNDWMNVICKRNCGWQEVLLQWLETNWLLVHFNLLTSRFSTNFTSRQLAESLRQKVVAAPFILSILLIVKSDWSQEEYNIFSFKVVV